ncbi:MAG: hypothetical protein KW806_02855 [Candidatus Yanofskybacteria bacterium]|nr:hypothetical protein [Candidatus Yanofskybacteria bacterium]
MATVIKEALKEKDQKALTWFGMAKWDFMRLKKEWGTFFRELFGVPRKEET